MASSVHWTEAETTALLSVWGSEQIQSELDGVVRNKKIYERTSNQLKRMVYRETGNSVVIV